MKRDKDRHYIMIKGSIQEEDITIINILCTPYRSTTICKENINKYERGDSNTIIVRDFNTPLTPMDRSTKQNIRKETQTLNDTME